MTSKEYEISLIRLRRRRLGARVDSRQNLRCPSSGCNRRFSASGAADSLTKTAAKEDQRFLRWRKCFRCHTWTWACILCRRESRRSPEFFLCVLSLPFLAASRRRRRRRRLAAPEDAGFAPRDEVAVDVEEEEKS